MIIVEPEVKLLEDINGEYVLQYIEKIARVCYKSEDLITEDSARKMIANLIKRGHEAMLEHVSIGVKITTDRGVTHEIVRHRIASYAQESTRYCNYGKEKFGQEITVINPFLAFDLDMGDITNYEKYMVWYEAMVNAQTSYMKLLSLGCTPQEARSVLPNSLKAEIVMTLNIRSWRNFFKLRCAKDAHPQMRQVAIMILNLFKSIIPVMFDDIIIE
jgi:thymidylate synthase (FAD)